MDISVVGLGKLGLCTATCFANAGLEVLGYDKAEELVMMLRDGKCYIDETGLEEPLKKVLENGKLHPSNDLDYCIANTDRTYIIVPTPSGEDGRFSNDYIYDVLEKMAPALKAKTDYHVVNIVSTVMPHSCAKFINMIESLTDKKCGKDFGLTYNPEFIAIGSVMHDFMNPDMVLIGYSDQKSLDIIKADYSSMDTTFNPMSLISAEVTKLSLNYFLALKISFANELAAICEHVPESDVDLITKAIGSDSRIGRKLLKPGLGFAGPCLKPETLVQTINGLKRIDEISVGEKVLTHKGVFQKVTEIYKRKYSGEMHRITSTGNPSHPIEATPEHPVWSSIRKTPYGRYRGSKNKERFNNYYGFGDKEFIPIHELKPGDSISMPIPNFNSKRIPMLEFDSTHWFSKIPPKIRLNPDIMRFFGYYLSEGCTWNSEVKITLHEDETVIAEDVISIIKKNFMASAKVRKHHGKAVKIQFSCTALAKFLRKTFGHGCHNKHIPHEWVQLPKPYISELMKGLWYGDGSNSCNIFTYGTVSPHLCKFIQLSLFRFGIVCNISIQNARKSKDGVNHRKAFYIRVANGSSYKKMNKLLPSLAIQKIPKGSNLTRTGNGSIDFNIKKTEIFQYNGMVYNLEVENDNSYVLDWGTVHNCLPRDNVAFGKFASDYSYTSKLSEATLGINENVINRIVSRIDGQSGNVVDIIGMSYKTGTSLTEGSQSILLRDRLVEGGYEVRTFDKTPSYKLMKDPDAIVMMSDSIEMPYVSTRKDILFIDPWRRFPELSDHITYYGMGRF